LIAVVSSETGEKWPTTLHKTEVQIVEKLLVGVMREVIQTDSWDVSNHHSFVHYTVISHLLTDTHVGKADPFSNFFPLKIFSTSLITMLLNLSKWL
jgi:hypothetical protein